MNRMTHIMLMTMVLFEIPCHCQKVILPRSGILPKIRAKIASLYPNATNFQYDPSYPYDSTQIVSIRCNCNESSSGIAITFDTNGNILNKDYPLRPIKELPDTILSYMSHDTLAHYRFGDWMTKSINNKGEISYSIYLMVKDTGQASSGVLLTILRFQKTGKLISIKKRWQNM